MKTKKTKGKVYKKCSICGIVANTKNKLEYLFYNDVATEDGFSNCCVECQKQFVADYTERNKEYIRERARLFNQYKKKKMKTSEYIDARFALAKQFGIECRVRV